MLTEYDARAIYLDSLDAQRTQLLSLPGQLPLLSTAKGWRTEVVRRIRQELMFLEAEASDITFEAECALIYSHDSARDVNIKAKARRELEDIERRVRKMRWQLKVLRQ